jgi:hypothetical protein
MPRLPKRRRRSALSRSPRRFGALAEFFSTAEGKLVQYRTRKDKRLLIGIDLEPQSKKMPDEEKDAFQRQVIDDLVAFRRSPFRGPIALSVRATTTRKSAPQAQTIAKNLLDLLGKRRPGVAGGQKSLLYKDDSQVNALVVSCDHGGRTPITCIGAMPFSAMLKDLELASEALQVLSNDLEHRCRYETDDDVVKDFGKLLKQEAHYRSRIGDKLYEALVKANRPHMQEVLLQKSTLDVAQLTWLYGLPRNPFSTPLSDMWDSIVRDHPLRINFGELPMMPGSSTNFIAHADERLHAFAKSWERFIKPLVVPVGVQVVVRLAPATPKGVLHDLDNIVRDYVLPRVIPMFDTVTAHRWTVDFDELRRIDPALARRWEAQPGPPRGTRAGVTHYEVWRLPPAASGSRGFVSVALVSGRGFGTDAFRDIDELIERWEIHRDDAD